MAYAKAFVAMLVAALGSLATGYSDGNLTVVEGLTAAINGLVALSVVFGVPNVPKAESLSSLQAQAKVLGAKIEALSK